MAKLNRTRNPRGLWQQPAGCSSSSSSTSSSSECETLSDASTAAASITSDTSSQLPSPPPPSSSSNAPGHSTLANPIQLTFQGGLAMLPCYLAPALTGSYTSKDRCRTCVKHKRTPIVSYMLNAHQLLDEIELAIDSPGSGNTGLVAALAQFVGRTMRSKQSKPRNGETTSTGNDWVALQAVLDPLHRAALLDCSGKLLWDRLRPLVSGSGPDSHEAWFLSSAIACLERLQIRLRLILASRPVATTAAGLAQAQAHSGQTRWRDAASERAESLRAYIRSDANRKALVPRQAKALAQCWKMIESLLALAIEGEHPSTLDIELSCLERALMMSASPVLLIDATGGSFQGARAWDAFREKAAWYISRRAPLASSPAATNGHDKDDAASAALSVALSKLKHLVLLGTRGDVNYFLHAAAPLTPNVEAICLIDTFWLHSTDPRFTTALVHEQIFSTRWTLPPNVVRLRALRQCVELEFASDDRQKDTVHVFAIQGSHTVERGLLDHPDIPSTGREETYPLRQRSLQVKLHDRMRFNASFSAAIECQRSVESVHSATDAEGENIKIWARIVAMYDDKFGGGKNGDDADPLSWMTAHFGGGVGLYGGDGRQRESEAAASVTPARSLERLTAMCLRTISASTAQGHPRRSLLSQVPPHFRWALALSYRCVSCEQIVLPPMEPLPIQVATAAGEEPISEDASGASDASRWTDEELSRSCGDTNFDSLPSLPTETDEIYSPQGLERIFAFPELLEINLEPTSDEEDFLQSMDHRLVSPAVRKGMLGRAELIQQVWKSILDAGFLPPMKEEIRLLRARRGSDDDDDDEPADTWTALKTGLASQHMYKSEQVDVHALIGPSSTSEQPRNDGDDGLEEGLHTSALDTDDGDGSDDSQLNSTDPHRRHRQRRHRLISRQQTLPWRFCLACFRSHVLLDRTGQGGSQRLRLYRKPPTPTQLQRELTAMEAASLSSNGRQCQCVVCREERDGAHYDTTGMECWVRLRRVPRSF